MATIITFSCRCGAALKAKAETAGKRTKCPQCNAVLTIPGGGAAPKPAAPPLPEDPFALDLDWSSIEADSKAAATAADAPPAGSGAVSITPDMAPAPSVV